MCQSILDLLCSAACVSVCVLAAKRLEVGTASKKPHGLIACNFRCARASQWQEVPHDDGDRDDPSIRDRDLCDLKVPSMKSTMLEK